MYVCMYVCINLEVHDLRPRRINVSRVRWPPPTVLQSTVGGGTARAWMSPSLARHQRGDMYAYIYIYIYVCVVVGFVPKLLRFADVFVSEP